jgi:hypothetical protein
MLRFNLFLKEQNESADKLLLERGVMDDKTGTRQNLRHVSKYISDLKGPNEYEIAKPHGGLEAGSKVQIHGTKDIGGVTHATVSSVGGGKKLDVPLRKIYKPGAAKQMRSVENTQVSGIQSEIERVKKETGKDHVVLHHNGQTYHITHAEQVPGNPKADVVLKDKKGKHVYLSLKGGTKPSDIHGYGGVTKVTGLHTTNVVNKLAAHVAKYFPEGVTKATPGVVLNKNNEEHGHIIKTSVFGKDYANKEKGVNNVHSVVQGKISLQPSKKKKGAFEIGASHITHNNGQVPEGEYQIHGHSQPDRHTKIGGHTLPYTRLYVAPVGARKITHPMINS